MALNISDKVKVINVDVFPEDIRIGDIATVENFGRWEETYVLRFTNGFRFEIEAKDVHIYVRKLRLAKPKFEAIRVFEVGDRVVFTENIMTCSELTIGEVGTVINVDKRNLTIDFGQGKLYNIDAYCTVLQKLEDLK